MPENINTVTITGNLTADPELRTTPSGMEICNLRVAVNGRRKEGDNWVDKPNFFDVTVFGGRGKSCAEHLAKGRPIAVNGRLDWSEWVDKDTQKKRSKVTIIADNIQFLGSGTGQQNTGNQNPPPAQQPAAGVQDDSDIPF
jgi:single-strand DNA-binding protein